MFDTDPKVLARLIKAEKKGKLIWQKTGRKGELISNGQWTVVVEEITAPAVRVALFSIFDKVIEPGESIEMAYGEIKENEADYFKEMHYEPEYATSATTLTKLTLGATTETPAARFLYDGDHLAAIDPENAELSYGTIAYRNQTNIYAPLFLGEHKEIMVLPIFPHNDKPWQDIVAKYTGVGK